jgi:hypothetical protein
LFVLVRRKNKCIVFFLMCKCINKNTKQNVIFLSVDQTLMILFPPHSSFAFIWYYICITLFWSNSRYWIVIILWENWMKCYEFILFKFFLWEMYDWQRQQLPWLASNKFYFEAFQRVILLRIVITREKSP